jgi:opacity protein-like surface antigen
LATWAGSVSLINAGVKIRAKRFYSILFGGAVNMTQEASNALAYGFQYGYGFPLRAAGGAGDREKRIEIDAGYLYLDNRTVFRHLKGTPDRHVLSLRGALSIDLSPGLTVFAGAGLKHTRGYGEPFSSGAVLPLVFAGVELF